MSHPAYLGLPAPAGSPVPEERAAGWGVAEAVSLDGVGSLVRDAILASDPGSAAYSQGGLSQSEQVRSLRHWVFVAVRAIRDACSAVPLRVFEGRGGPEVVDPLDPLRFLISHPNPWDTDIEFWATVFTQLELSGNALLLKVRDSLGVAELWPLPVQFMRPRFARGAFVGYSWQDGAAAFDIPAEDVLHVRYPNPTNRFWGLGTLAAAVPTMRALDGIDAAQLAAFSDEILSDVVFTTDGTLDDAAFRRMRSQLLERYGGAARSGLPLLLENGMRVDRLRRAPAEMGFRESQNSKSLQVLSVFGVPPIAAGIVENANRSNSEVQWAAFMQTTIWPKLRLVAARLNRDPEIVPVGRWVEFDSPVPKDEAARTARLSGLVARGVIAPNEAAVELGYEPTEWGRYPQWVWQAALGARIPELSAAALAAHAAAAPAAPAAPVAPIEAAGDADDESDDGAAAAAARSVAVAAPVHRLAASAVAAASSPAPVVRALAATVQARADADLDRIEDRCGRSVRRFFALQLDRIVDALPRVFGGLPADAVRAGRVRAFLDTDGRRCYPDGTKRGVSVPDGEFCRLGPTFVDSRCSSGDGEWRWLSVRSIDPSLVDELDDWQRASDELARRMGPFFGEAMEAGAALQADTLGTDATFTLRHPDAERWLGEKQRPYWDRTVMATTHSQLSEALGAVMAEGPTLDSLRAAVEKVFRGDPKGRPRGDGGRFASSATIARTEVIGAYNAGSSIQRDLLGVSRKQWLATIDVRTRSTHRAANGQMRRNGEPFLVGSERLQYPGDPAGGIHEIANCRCVALALPSLTDDLAPA